MPLYIKDIDDKIIDLERSIIDENHSDPKKRIYKFHKKVYYDLKRAKLDGIETCPWKFGWCNKNPQIVGQWRFGQGWDFVTTDDQFVPEGYPGGVILNVEGHYEFGDLVLMKMPLRDWIAQKLEKERAEQSALTRVKHGFQADAEKDGLALSKSDLERLGL
jgi:hypothetical protein